MKVLAFNCSPKMDNGLTAKLLNPFLDGIKSTGTEVETVYTKKLIIRPCDGCYKCWFLTPGKCTTSDDMQEFIEKWPDSDIIVIGAPLYSDGLPSTMKSILDRRLPLSIPKIIKKGGSCHHKIRYETAGKKLVLLSTCGFWGMDNFDPLIAHLKAVCKNGEREFAGAILRPQSIALENRFSKANKEKIEKIYDACRKAGTEVVENGRISEKTLSEINVDLMQIDEYIEAANTYFQEVGEIYRNVVADPGDEDLLCY